MDILIKIVELMTIGSVVFAAINVYLTLNKLWKRKHLAVVAESISLFGRFIAITAISLMLVDFIRSSHWFGAADRIIYLLAAIVQVLIGAGLWIEDRKNKPFWTLIRQALRSERAETANLAMALFRPSHAEKILDILTQVALIDNELANKEKRFIQSFAKSWSIHINWTDLEKRMKNGQFNYDRLRRSMEYYLATAPPMEQASQLGDLISNLVNVDNDVSQEEELILAELLGLIGNYVNQNSLKSLYNVAIIPQTKYQDKDIKEILPEAQRQSFGGGYAYFIGPYYSEKYAEVICEKYRLMDYLAVPIALEVSTQAA